MVILLNTTTYFICVKNKKKYWYMYFFIEKKVTYLDRLWIQDDFWSGSTLLTTHLAILHTFTGSKMGLVEQN